MVEIYRNHLIVASAIPDPARATYIAAAAISWQADGKRQEHILRLEERFDNSLSANRFALAAAKNWIDDNLTTL
jgi:hypothetical protein